MLARFREEDFFGSCYGIGMPPIRISWIRNLLHASATAVVGGEVNGKWTRTIFSTTFTLGMERPGLLVSAMGKVFSIHSRYDDSIYSLRIRNMISFNPLFCLWPSHKLFFGVTLNRALRIMVELTNKY